MPAGNSRSNHCVGAIPEDDPTHAEEPALIERILAHARGQAESDTAALGPPSTGPPVSA